MPLNYSIIAQDKDQLLDVRNSPAISMGDYLLRSGQIKLLNHISIYGEKGTTREQMRLLYMNAAALATWKAMGHSVAVTGEVHRPPHSATLIFGMPFSE